MDTSNVNHTIGLLCAVGSAFFNGSFTVPFKLRKSDNDGGSSIVHPIVFTLYVSIGVSLSSWLLIPFLNNTTNSLICFPAIISGWLFVLGVAASFLAIDYIGMALAQGVWAGSATLVSYFWGTIIFGEIPSSPATSVIGLVILIAGVMGIVFSDTIGKNLTNHSNYEAVDEEENEDDTRKNAADASLYWRGVVWASLVGIFGGSILAPTHYVPLESQGFAILPSFGIGTITLAPALFLIHIWWTKVTPPLNMDKAFFPGLLSGLIWNVSNVMSLIAIPVIGYSVAYPLLQGAVLVSGLWGIFVFKEISKQSTIMAFWCGSAVLIIGAVTLALSQ